MISLIFIIYAYVSALTSDRKIIFLYRYKMNVPNYFWKCLIIMMFVHEARMIYETYMGFRDDDDEEMPESIKHLYS